MREEAQETEDRTRQRVVWVSVIYGILVIVTGAGGYCLQTVFLQDLAEHIQELASAPGASPSLKQVQIPDASGLSGAANSAAMILIGLAVPACGFLGARWRQKECLFAFCGCSCMSCLCNVFMLMVLVLYLSIITVLDTNSDALRQCDPYLLCPKEAGIWQTERVVDCFAKSTWPTQYNRLYPDYGMQNPPVCHLDVLDCDPDPAPARSAQADLAAKLAAAERKEEEELERSFEEEEEETPKRLRRLFAQIPALPDVEWSMKVANAVAGGSSDGEESRMPASPLNQCRSNTVRIELTHGLVTWLSGALPKFRNFTILLVLVTLVASVLSCLSVWWGKQLHDIVGQPQPAFEPLWAETRAAPAQPQAPQATSVATAPQQPQYALPRYAVPQYAQPQYAQPQFAQPQYTQPLQQGRWTGH